DPTPVWYDLQKDFDNLKSKVDDDATLLSEIRDAVKEIYGSGNKYRNILLQQFGEGRSDDASKIVNEFSNGMRRLTATQKAVYGLSIGLSGRLFGEEISYAELLPFFEKMIEDGIIEKSDVRFLAGEKAPGKTIQEVLDKIMNQLGGKDGEYRELVSLVIDSNFGENASVLELLRGKNATWPNGADSFDKFKSIISEFWADGLPEDYKRTWNKLNKIYPNLFQNMLYARENAPNTGVNTGFTKLSDPTALLMQVPVYSAFDILSIIRSANKNTNSYLLYMQEDQAGKLFDAVRLNNSSLTFDLFMLDPSGKINTLYNMYSDRNSFAETAKKIADVMQEIVGQPIGAKFKKLYNRSDAALEFIKGIRLSDHIGLSNLMSMTFVRDQYDRVVAIRDPSSGFEVMRRDDVQQSWDLSQIKNLKLKTPRGENFSVDRQWDEIKKYLNSNPRFIGSFYIDKNNPNLTFQIEPLDIEARIKESKADIVRKVDPFGLRGIEGTFDYQSQKIKDEITHGNLDLSLLGPNGSLIRGVANIDVSKFFDENGKPITDVIRNEYQAIMQRVNTQLGTVPLEITNLAATYMIGKNYTLQQIENPDQSITTTTLGNRNTTSNYNFDGRTGSLFVQVRHKSQFTDNENTNIKVSNSGEQLSFVNDPLNKENIESDIVLFCEGNYYKVVFDEKNDIDGFQSTIKNLVGGKDINEKLNYAFLQSKYAEVLQNVGNYTMVAGTLVKNQEINEYTHEKTGTQETSSEDRQFSGGKMFFFGSEVKFNKFDISSLGITNQTEDKSIMHNQNWAGVVQINFDGKDRMKKLPTKSMVFGVYDLRWNQTQTANPNDIDGTTVQSGYQGLGENTKLAYVSYKVLDKLNMTGIFGGNDEVTKDNKNQSRVAGMRVDSQVISGSIAMRWERKDEKSPFTLIHGITSGKLTTKAVDMIGYADLRDKQEPQYGTNIIVKLSEKDRILIHANKNGNLRNLDQATWRGIVENITLLSKETDIAKKDWDQKNYSEQQNQVYDWTNRLNILLDQAIDFAPGQDFTSSDVHFSAAYETNGMVAGMASSTFDVDRKSHVTLIAGNDVSTSSGEKFAAAKYILDRGIGNKQTQFSFAVTKSTKQFSFVQQVTDDLFLTGSISALNDIGTIATTGITNPNKFSANLIIGTGDKFELYGGRLGLKYLFTKKWNDELNVSLTKNKQNDLNALVLNGTYKFQQGNFGMGVTGTFTKGWFRGKEIWDKKATLNVFYLF
ncbi:MAG: hypothetical protein NTV88_02245, partial [Candidatus Micrarchaeota archaeon]|nr:hypothetical protein [Candidatus Micrarchaeota archaeon]